MSKNPKLLSLLLKQTTKNSSSLMTGERDPNGVLFVHEFDSDGKIVEVIDGVDASWIFSSTTTSTSQRYDMTNPEGEIIAYGNIDRVFITTLPSSDIITKTTTYNNHGELLTQSDNTLDDQLEVYGNNTYTYNDDGYLTQKTTPEGTTSYPYGTSGELKEVVTPTNTITYLHNAQNQRVAKLVDGNITEKYLWANLTTLLAIYDKDNNLLQRFTYTDNRMPISMTSNGVKYYLHYSQIGTLKAVSNTNHNIVKQLTYDTYGNILTDTNQTLKVPFGFAGGLYDVDTKLTRFGYRDYDAYTGKWTAKDPIGFAGGDSNLYGYVLGDPVNFIDPTGELLWVPIFFGLTAYLNAPSVGGSTYSGPTPWAALLPFGKINPSGPICMVTRWQSPASSGLASSNWVMMGNKTRWNWTMSGKNQFGFGKNHVPFQNGRSFPVPRNSLRYPKGWERFKGLPPWNQRQIK